MSRFDMWMEEHWHGWVKPVSGLMLIAIAYVAYSQQWVTEGVAGPMLVAVIVGGTIAGAAVAVFPVLEKARDRNLFAGFLAVWAIAVGYPSLRASLPRQVLAEKRIGDTKEHLSETITLPGSSGPYELSVGGSLKGGGEVEASYQLTVSGEGDTTDEVSGSIDRKFQSVRTSRRGGRSSVRQEHRENVHRLEHVRGQTLKLTLEGVDDQLEDGIFVTVHPAGPDPRLFLVAAALCMLVGLFVDYQLATTKTKTYLTMAAGFLFAFAWYYPTQATPHFLVPPAISSAVIAFLSGGLGGALAGFIGRQVKPPAKMKPKMTKEPRPQELT
jgi:hypothetical protein